MGGFWPDNLNDWLQLVVVYAASLVALLAAGWRVLRTPLDERISSNRDKISLTREDVSGVKSDYQNLKSILQAAEFDRQHLREKQGALDERFNQLMSALEQGRREEVEEEKEVIRRLAVIETKVDVFSEIKSIFIDRMGG